MRGPDFDDEALAKMYLLRTRYRYPWTRIAEVVGSSAPRVKKLLEDYEKRRMAARGSKVRWMHRDLRGKRSGPP